MQNIKTVLFFLPILLAVSCSDLEFIIPESDEGKEMISFSVSSDEALATRAGFCGGDTFIAMRMMSESKKDASPLYTRTTAIARQDMTASTTSWSDVSFAESEKRYWDDAHGQYSKLSVYAVAIPNMATDVKGLATPSGGLLPAGNGSNADRWGTVATNSIVWGVTTGMQSKDDSSDNSAIVNERSGSVDQEDLVYSNNIQAGGTDGVYRWNFDDERYEPSPTGEALTHSNGQMVFMSADDKDNPLATPSSAQGKFDKGHLIFRHALSRITVTLTAGEGFTDPAAFCFTDDSGTKDGSTIRLLNMKTAGTLDLPTGDWHDVTTGDIAGMGRKGAGTTAAGTFVGQMLPGYAFADGKDTNVMSFIIDGNTYYITQDMLYDALNKTANQKTDYGYTTGKFTMMQGKNYQFTFIIKKRKIELITATLVPWENVIADNKDMNNARIKLKLEERGTEQTSNVAFYKADDNKTTDGIDDNYAVWNWTKGYTKITSAEYSSDHWTTGLFWETSKDFYHFRALMPETTGFTSDDANGDYATLTSESNYTDVRWGAPMLDDGDNVTAGSFKWLYGPTSGGFDHADDNKVATGLPDGTTHQIYKAIGATEDPVKLTLFHVMSDLTFNISTTDGTDKVELCHDNGAGADPRYTHTRLDLVGFYNGGKVLLGTGIVKTTGSESTVASPVNIGAPTDGSTGAYTDKTFHFGAVPQDLTAVKLYITTPDGNQYIIDLKDVKATTVSSENLANPYTKGSDGKYTLDRWYPGFRYTYNITLKKTGITNLQATVVDWETVTADNETVTIK